MIFNIGDRYSRLFIISKKINQQFIKLFEDRNPLHTDEQFAISKGFKGKVMHGNILNGFLSFFIGECLPTKNVIIHLQEIQYKKAVYINDKLQFMAEVNEVYESVNAVMFNFTFQNEELEIVAKGKIQIGILI